MILVAIYRFITQYMEYKEKLEEAEEHHSQKILAIEDHRI